MKTPIALAGASALVLGLAMAPADLARAQEAEELEEVVVTGSRIRRDPLNEAVAIMEIGQQDLNRTGLTNLGEALQELPIAGASINSQHNVPGNSGFPQDGNGIGAGAVQLSIRGLGAKRTLILVDGRRWIPGASASGVPVAVDLNTIPDNVIERIEVLQDGASAIYGSDAIGGVVNVITRKGFEGFRLDAHGGGYLSDGDGESYRFGALWGAGNDTTHITMSASYSDERGIETFDRSRSSFPNPDASSCDVPGSQCSSFTPQARIILGPALGGQDITLNDGVLNDGMNNIPVWDPNDPNGGDFHAFSNADRFNFNGPGFNYLRTPNERVNLYANVRHEFTDNISLFATGSYTNRQSRTQGAPEPFYLGPGSGNQIMENIEISADNPFNPFGVDLSSPLGTLSFLGRRPLESGGRKFFQDVNTYMGTIGLEGDFSTNSRSFYWDLYTSYGDNRGFQEKENSHSAARIQTALRDPDVCAAVPNCVPLNLFGGQGPDGSGSITEEMLDFIRFTQRDFSEQTMLNVAGNIGGDVIEIPGGMVGFAAGFEYREHEGSFRPDPVAASGETAGIPSAPTVGEFDVTEFYGELNIPLLSGITGADLLELNLAARNSDYSTSGDETTFKVSGLWRPVAPLSLRASFSTGFRAPGIGELFGGAAREDFTFTDPCVDYTGIVGADQNGRDDPQPQNIQDNCAALGVQPGLTQLNPQLSAAATGNEDLQAETSDNFMAGFVYSPAWAEGRSWSEGMTFTIDFYNVEVEDAIQGISPDQIITACVNTLDPVFCDNVPRTPSGRVGLVQNKLQNIGSIETSGLDIMYNYLSPDTTVGQFILNINATYLDEYKEITNNPDGTQTVNDLTGRHPEETFQRAFPEWRATTSLDWVRNRFSGSLSIRWVDEMLLDSGETLDSVAFTDIRASYNPSWANDALTFTIGFNNVLDEDPPVCNCQSIGLSRVMHDLPGRVGYVRVSYQPQ